MKNSTTEPFDTANSNAMLCDGFLIPMTDFIDKFLHTGDLNYQLRVLNNYKDFLKKHLKLEMFVPCDEDGNILKEPKRWEDYLQYPDSFDGNKEWDELYDYQQAKEKVLFEGFYYQSNFSEKQNKLYEYIRNKHPHVFSFEQINNSTVESLLIGYKKEFLITLTETAIKQIGL